MSRSDPSRCPAWCECTPCQRQSSRALDRMHAYLHTRTHLRAQNARTDTTHLLVVTVITLIDFGLYLRRQHARPRPHRRRQPHRGHPAASPTPAHGKIADGLLQVLKTMLLAVAFVRDRSSRRNLACRWPVPQPCPCHCPHQLARRAAVPSCLPDQMRPMQQAPAAICAQGSAPLADPNDRACTFNSKSKSSRTSTSSEKLPPLRSSALQCNRETPP